MRIIKPAVHILASGRNGTLYIGVTGDLAARVSIHQQDLANGFTKRYGVRMLCITSISKRYRTPSHERSN